MTDLGNQVTDPILEHSLKALFAIAINNLSLWFVALRKRPSSFLSLTLCLRRRSFSRSRSVRGMDSFLRNKSTAMTVGKSVGGRTAFNNWRPCGRHQSRHNELPQLLMARLATNPHANNLVALGTTLGLAFNFQLGPRTNGHRAILGLRPTTAWFDA